KFGGLIKEKILLSKCHQDHIINDLKRMVNDYKADGITILDDHFFINEQRLIEVCNRIKSEKINIKFRACGRIDSFAKLSESTYDLLKKVGFISIGAGIESGSPRMLKYINKNITLEDIEKVDNLFSKFGIFKHWNFITAFPGETIYDIKLTLKLIVKLAYTCFSSPFPFSSYNRFIPLPGTKLFNIAKEEYGLKEPKFLEEWIDFSQKYRFDGKGYDPKIWPWITKDVGDLMFKAECLVHELNSYYIGEDADIMSIKKSISKIEKLINIT
ncbi:radical SAM/B12-binding domain-containing protein, partial [Candidatus Magnetomorum sp. HK-1]